MSDTWEPVMKPDRSWTNVSRRQPCPHCGHHRWCRITADGTTICCRHNLDGGIVKTDLRGDPYCVVQTHSPSRPGAAQPALESPAAHEAAAVARPPLERDHTKPTLDELRRQADADPNWTPTREVALAAARALTTLPVSQAGASATQMEDQGNRRERSRR
jgi:hypothetical protein